MDCPLYNIMSVTHRAVCRYILSNESTYKVSGTPRVHYSAESAPMRASERGERDLSALLGNNPLEILFADTGLVIGSTKWCRVIRSNLKFTDESQAVREAKRGKMSPTCCYKHARAFCLSDCATFTGEFHITPHNSTPLGTLYFQKT